MYFRVWGNYGHTPDTWHGHVIGQCTSQFGHKKTLQVIPGRSQMPKQRTYSFLRILGHRQISVKQLKQKWRPNFRFSRLRHIKWVMNIWYWSNDGLTTSPAAGHSSRQCLEWKTSGFKYLENTSERGQPSGVSARREGIYRRRSWFHDVRRSRR